MDVSGRILQTWMPAIPAGMTKSALSLSVGKRKVMNHFVVTRGSLYAIHTLLIFTNSLMPYSESSRP